MLHEYDHYMSIFFNLVSPIDGQLGTKFFNS